MADSTLKTIVPPHSDHSFDEGRCVSVNWQQKSSCTESLEFHLLFLLSTYVPVHQRSHKLNSIVHIRM